MSNPTMGFELQEKLASLQEKILSQHPMMPVLLKEIWMTLKKQPENVTLLSEEHIRAIVAGCEKQTGVYLAESVAKTSKKSAAVASLKSKGADAF